MISIIISSSENINLNIPGKGRSSHSKSDRQSQDKLTRCPRGLEADQRTLAAHGCYAMTATTALTAQNTLGVEDVHVIPPAFVGKQIRKVMEDGFMDDEPGVVKVGMSLLSVHKESLEIDMKVSRYAGIS